MKNKNNIKINNLKINSVRLIALLLAGVSLTSCSSNKKSENDISFKTVIEMFADDTYLDEILESDEVVKIITVEEISQLENLLLLSEKLNDLDLSEDIIIPNGTDLNSIDITNINDDIELYKTASKDEKEELQNKLILEEMKVNNQILNGYKTIDKMGLVLVKTVVAEIYGIDASEITNMKIVSDTNLNSDSRAPFKIMLGDKSYTVRKGDLLDGVLLIICSAQSQENAVSDGNAQNVYNKDRNKLITDALNEYKVCIACRHGVTSSNPSEIRTLDSKNDARELIKSKTITYKFINNDEKTHNIIG